ncbi:hypothetical protein ASE36_21790 [Rhizobium sp. Root274]|uniref:TetR/AcrR family transcriptional regulator n=1 Tax=unclassified Rhizobium TaxID=2613769 RepID=UPI0007134DD2|nr:MULTISPECIES: TetR/AcrR family transcriptional regulator [unclassified Rhizobium]KQW30252.1 hypothetical protein ASC71_21850 [Rhizobium sp. Root1240]KRD31743.1 hypothetical protein ASE36_21790 [Rhizobium sp. Root274]
MARPKSEEKRKLILSSALQLIAEQGLGASTADIAKRAKLPHGSVFTYFETKADLLNALYLELKQELAGVILEDLPYDDKPRAQLEHLWLAWTAWGMANPSSRRALAQLSVSDQISDGSRNAAFALAAPAIGLLRSVSSTGALTNVSENYVNAIVEALVSATIDYMLAYPKEGNATQKAGFELLWRAISA